MEFENANTLQTKGKTIIAALFCALLAVCVFAFPTPAFAAADVSPRSSIVSLEALEKGTPFEGMSFNTLPAGIYDDGQHHSGVGQAVYDFQDLSAALAYDDNFVVQLENDVVIPDSIVKPIEVSHKVGLCLNGHKIIYNASQLEALFEIKDGAELCIGRNEAQDTVGGIYGSTPAGAPVSSSVFRVLEGGTLNVNCLIDGVYSAIKAQGGYCGLYNVSIANGKGASDSAVHAENGTVYMRGGSIEVGSNFCGKGGCFYLDANTSASIENASLIGGGVYGFNAPCLGGCLYSAGDCVIENSVLEGSLVAQNGGCIYQESGSLTLKAGTILKNAAVIEVRQNQGQGLGGGIYQENGTCTVESGAQIINCKAACNGGGIFLENGNLHLDGSVSRGSGVSGGNIFQKSGTLAISGSVTEGSATDGGGVFSCGGDVILDGASLQKNRASHQGGALALSPSSRSINLSFKNAPEFLLNRAQSQGNDLYLDYLQTLSGVSTDRSKTITAIIGTMQSAVRVALDESILNGTAQPFAGNAARWAPYFPCESDTYALKADNNGNLFFCENRTDTPERDSSSEFASEGEVGALIAAGSVTGEEGTWPMSDEEAASYAAGASERTKKSDDITEQVKKEIADYGLSEALFEGREFAQSQRIANAFALNVALANGGDYILENDIVLSKDDAASREYCRTHVISSDVGICFNGHKIIFDGADCGPLFEVREGKTLTLGRNSAGDSVGGIYATVDAESIPSANYGGVCHVNGGILNVNCVIDGAAASPGDWGKETGGAITLSRAGGECRIIGADIRNCQGSDAGAIALHGGRVAHISGSIHDCSTRGWGTIAIHHGDYTLYDGLICDNSTDHGGSAFDFGNKYLSDGWLRIFGGEITRNFGLEDMGALNLCNGGGAVLAKDAHIFGNIGLANGSAVRVGTGSTLFMTGGSIEGNLNPGWGSCLRVLNGGNARITGGSLEATPCMYGGCIYNAGVCDIVDCTLYGNTAAYGGCIYNESGWLQLGDGARLEGGEAIDNALQEGKGGGIYLERGYCLVGPGATIAKCHADSYGGAIYHARGTLNMNGTISNCTSDCGGGVFSTSGLLALDGVVFKSNAADYAGGAVLLSPILGDIDLQLKGDTLFQRNKASETGADLYLDFEGTITATDPFLDTTATEYRIRTAIDGASAKSIQTGIDPQAVSYQAWELARNAFDYRNLFVYDDESLETITIDGNLYVFTNTFFATASKDQPLYQPEEPQGDSGEGESGGAAESVADSAEGSVSPLADTGDSPIPIALLLLLAICLPGLCLLFAALDSKRTEREKR